MAKSETRLIWREAFTVRDSIAAAVAKGQIFMATPQHGQAIELSVEGLRRHFEDQPDVFIATELPLCSNPDDLRKCVVPDLMVARVQWDSGETTYRTWEAPAPLFVLEVASRTTADRDSGFKKGEYERLKVWEYWQLDPSGELLRAPLTGYRLHGKSYQPIGPCGQTAGELWYWSEALGLYLRAERHPDVLTVQYRDPITGKDVLVGKRMSQAFAKERAGRLAFKKQAAEERAGRLAATRRAVEASRQAAEERAGRLAFKRQAAEERAGRLAFKRQAAEERAGRLASKRQAEEYKEQIKELQADLLAAEKRLAEHGRD